MKLLHAFTGYLGWHYSSGFVGLTHILGNFLWFVVHFFSIPTLLGTLFAPINRLNEGYVKGDSLEGKASTFVANIFVRFVGFILRLFLISLGIVVLGILLIFGIAAFVSWLLAPLVIVFFIGFGISFF